jgi:antitoxin CcdA
MRMETTLASPSRRATNLSVSQTVLDEARSMDINLSRAAEDGIRQAVAAEKARRFRDEYADVIRSNNEYVEKHGLPLEKYRLF